MAETGDRFETLAPFPSISDDGTAAFAATLSGGGEGVFTQRGDDPRSRHDADGAFESYRGALITNAAQLVWMARPRGGNRGLFAGPDPEADRILALGDELLGSEITDVRSNPVSVNAVGQVAIAAVLADGRQLILRADPGD